MRAFYCRAAQHAAGATLNSAPGPGVATAPADARRWRGGGDDRQPEVAIKAGGGTRGHDGGARLAEAAARSCCRPATGVLPHAHAQNMHVGGSKGSISGNHAMERGELLIVIGSRAVCQADCSGVGYPNVQAVININGDVTDVTHYNRTLALPGDIGAVLEQLLDALRERGGVEAGTRADWLMECRTKKEEWRSFCAKRYAESPIYDAVWGRRC